MATIVTGDQSVRIGNKLAEIQRQLYLQRDGYPYDPMLLEDHLQAAVEGKFAAGELVVAAKTATAKLLAFVTSVTVPSVKHFAAAEHFRHGETVEGVKCYLWGNFKTQFGEKIEKNVTECKLRVHKLLRNSRDLNIRTEITEEKEETFLAHIWEMLKLQPTGEKGALLTNGYANIFYVRDTEGVLWAVDAHWSAFSSEWILHARSVERPHVWSSDSQVFSR